MLLRAARRRGKRGFPGFGGNVQAVIRPDGLPIWVSEVVAGHHHDLPVARIGVYSPRCTGPPPSCGYRAWPMAATPAPAWACTPRSRTPVAGRSSRVDDQIYNTLHRATRCRGQRGFALLTGRWKALRRITASPRRIGHYVKAALVLVRIEQLQLRRPC